MSQLSCHQRKHNGIQLQLQLRGWTKADLLGPGSSPPVSSTASSECSISTDSFKFPTTTRSCEAVCHTMHQHPRGCSFLLPTYRKMVPEAIMKRNLWSLESHYIHPALSLYMYPLWKEQPSWKLWLLLATHLFTIDVSSTLSIFLFPVSSRSWKPETPSTSKPNSWHTRTVHWRKSCHMNQCYYINQSIYE